VFSLYKRLFRHWTVVFLSIYAVFEGYDEAGNWFVYSVVSYILGGSFKKSAQGWREGLSWWVRYRFLITPIALAILIATGFSLFDDPGSDNTSP
jgi:hypothetical protein